MSPTDRTPLAPFAGISPATAARLSALADPPAVQAFVEALPYNPEPVCRPVGAALAAGRAHCLEGALIAAAALRLAGRPPLLVDLRAVNDDDHVLVVFRQGRLWGAVAKSNTTVLGFREPVYRSLRELAMSFFDVYYNTLGEKTLRAYSLPLDLARCDGLGWAGDTGDMEAVGDLLDARRHIPLLPDGAAARLAKVGPRLFAAGFLDSVPEGLYQAEEASGGQGRCP